MYKMHVQLECTNSLLCSSSSLPLCHHRPTFMLLSSVICLYIQLFPPPPVSLRNKAEIPSGVRRDWRGNSVQWGGEALSPCPPQCVQPCRTLHRQAAAKQKGSGGKSYSGGQRAGPDQRSLPRSRWLTGRWAWARGIFLGVLFRDAFLLSLPRRIPSPLPL